MFSVVAHEVAHGYAAYIQGDNTARFQGRLTLNPLKHLEWFGSVILPFLSYQFGGFIQIGRATRSDRDWSSDVCSSDLIKMEV